MRMRAQNFNPRDVYVRHRVEEASKEKWMDECGKQLELLRKMQEASGKGNFTVQPGGGVPSAQNEDGGIVRFAFAPLSDPTPPDPIPFPIPPSSLGSCPGQLF